MEISNWPGEEVDEYAKEPVATGLMRFGILDRAAFDASYGSGPSSRNKEYGFQFAYALATQAVLAIQAAGGDSVGPRENSALPQAVARLGAGALNLDAEAFTFAMDYFKAGLLQIAPAWAGRAPRPLAGGAQLPPGPLPLGLEAKVAITHAISSIEAFGSQGRALLIDTLSDHASSGEVPEMLIRARVLSQRAQIAAGVAHGKPGFDARTL